MELPFEAIAILDLAGTMAWLYLTFIFLMASINAKRKFPLIFALPAVLIFLRIMIIEEADPGIFIFMTIHLIGWLGTLYIANRNPDKKTGKS